MTRKMENKKVKKHGKARTIKRLLGYIVKDYKLQITVVLISIIISALVGVAGIESKSRLHSFA